MTRQTLTFVAIWLFSCLCGYAQGVENLLENPDEDFVIASVIVASSGEEIYSEVGHACLRLQCPEHNLDFVFSEESEDVSHKVLQFFAGNLKMGVRAVPTRKCINEYAEDGRGLLEYKLNLPIKVKQRLWQQMDERLEEDDIPYDFLNNGCAVSVLSWLEEAIDADSLQYAEWPEYYDMTRREIVSKNVISPWGHVFFTIFIAGDCNDPDVSKSVKVVLPKDLVEVLGKAKAYGRPLLNGKPTTLLKPTREVRYSWFTPDMLAIILLLIAIANVFVRKALLRIPVLAIGAAIGCFVLYLVCFSDLTCTEWNWLIVPLFPLPLFAWKWRKYWALPMAAICIVWSIAMVASPHELEDMALIILAVATAVTYFEIYKSSKTIKV